MARWAVGDAVEVYDGDLERWIPGWVDSVGTYGDSARPMIVVETVEVAFDLPLRIAIVTHPSGEDPRLRRAPVPTTPAPRPSGTS